MLIEPTQHLVSLESLNYYFFTKKSSLPFSYCHIEQELKVSFEKNYVCRQKRRKKKNKKKRKKKKRERERQESKTTEAQVYDSQNGNTGVGFCRKKKKEKKTTTPKCFHSKRRYSFIFNLSTRKKNKNVRTSIFFKKKKIVNPLIEKVCVCVILVKYSKILYDLFFFSLFFARNRLHAKRKKKRKKKTPSPPKVLSLPPLPPFPL